MKRLGNHARGEEREPECAIPHAGVLPADDDQERRSAEEAGEEDHSQPRGGARAPMPRGGRRRRSEQRVGGGRGATDGVKREVALWGGLEKAREREEGAVA